MFVLLETLLTVLGGHHCSQDDLEGEQLFLLLEQPESAVSSRGRHCPKMKADQTQDRHLCNLCRDHIPDYRHIRSLGRSTYRARQHPATPVWLLPPDQHLHLVSRDQSSVSFSHSHLKHAGLIFRLPGIEHVVSKSRSRRILFALLLVHAVLSSCSSCLEVIQRSTGPTRDRRRQPGAQLRHRQCCPCARLGAPI